MLFINSFSLAMYFNSPEYKKIFRPLSKRTIFLIDTISSNNIGSDLEIDFS